jgi:hypothetical protein
MTIKSLPSSLLIGIAEIDKENRINKWKHETGRNRRPETRLGLPNTSEVVEKIE